MPDISLITMMLENIKSNDLLWHGGDRCSICCARTSAGAGTVGDTRCESGGCYLHYSPLIWALVLLMGLSPFFAFFSVSSGPSTVHNSGCSAPTPFGHTLVCP